VINHPHGISQLTAARSQDVLGEGRRRQLAETALPGPWLVVRGTRRLVPAWALRASALTTSLVWSWMGAHTRGTAAPDWAAPLPTSKPAVTGETL